jgi:hypothetical protein
MLLGNCHFRENRRNTVLQRVNKILPVFSHILISFYEHSVAVHLRRSYGIQALRNLQGKHPNQRLSKGVISNIRNVSVQRPTS